ncbi:MAG: hypothetical protein JWM74_2629, partial [Myxococcaceae bacterium]|nr:hypothetical protein [Myxococcaceae bacterium]
TLKELDATLAPVLERPEIAEAATMPIASGCRTSPGAKLLVCHAVRIFPNPDGTHEVIYVQGSSRRAVRALYDLRYQLARLSLVTLPFALLLAWWMGTRMVTPIEELQKEVLDAAASARPAPALTTTEGDEMGDLARAFNELLGSLEERRGANERFVADLVHELKNPVATIRACAEALASGAVDETRAERLAKVLADSSTRLDTLVSQFLEIARAEAGMPSEDRARVDLTELAHGLAEAMRARHPNVTFEVAATGEALVLGVPHRLDSVVRNLVENAASFAPGGGRVEIALSQSETAVVLRVTDTGPGIPDEDLPKVFTRFFTTRGREHGTGLGLALVRAVVEAHGGTVTAANAPTEGAVFEIALPKFTEDSHDQR